MNKTVIFCVCCAIFGVICWVLIKIFFWGESNPGIEYPRNTGENRWNSNGNIHVLTSIDDDVVDNSMWCGTFQLVWNDMVNNIVKKDVVFSPQLKSVENLNKQTFTNKELSPNSYYAKFGLLTLDLKDEIEKGIKKKFNETSDILDQLDWTNVPQSDSYYRRKDEKKYGFYAMLKKIFRFENAFDERDAGKFADTYNNIRYFGIKGSSSDKLYNQVYVYYYDSDKDFAVALKTLEGEDVILARGLGSGSFINNYESILRKEHNYQGEHYFTENDYLKVPELKLKTLTEFYDLENKKFYADNGNSCHIERALQTIELKLDKEGGEIKSEAWIEMMEDAIMFEIEHRYFYFDEPYIMMLKESNKNLPYFAAQISDITLFQN